MLLGSKFRVGWPGLPASQISHPEKTLLLIDPHLPDHVHGSLRAAEHAQKLDPRPHIIFTTAYDAYAIRAFDLNAIDLENQDRQEM